MWLGLCVVAVPPSPKVHLQPATLPSGSLLASVKLQARLVQLGVNAATGGWFGGGGCAVMSNGLLGAPVSPLALAARV